jgi:radical SAM superfamily enzyme YgiQ (UPF0313 family)
VKETEMKFLFVVHPAFLFEDAAPYGVSMVATVAKQAGLDVDMLVGEVMESDTSFYRRVTETIRKEKVDVVCLGALSYHYIQAETIIRLAKQEGCLTILGGAITDPNPDLIAEHIGADYCVLGEGEESFKALAFALENGEDVRDVPSLVYKSADGDIVKTVHCPYIANLDALPFVDDEISGIGASVRTNHVLYLYMSRSCPYRCTFCYHFKGAPYRQRSLDNVFAELEHFLAKYGKDIRRVVFMDDLFNIDKKHVMEFCMRIKHYGLRFSVQVRMDKIDRESVESLKDAGCCSIVFGLESANDRVLKSMKKQMRISEIKKKMDMVLDAGISLYANLIFGDIEEDVDTVCESMELFWTYSQRMVIGLTRIEVYPGTHLYCHAMDKGIISDELTYLRKTNPLVNVSKLSPYQYEAIGEMCHNNMYAQTKSFHLLEKAFMSLCLRVDGSFDYAALCPHCFAKVSFKNNASVRALMRLNGAGIEAPQTCEHCNKLLIVPQVGSVYTNPMRAEAFFSPYVGKRIVVYGLGFGLLSPVRALLLHSQTLRSCLTKVVDRNWKNLSNETYCGLSVESPDILREVQFDYLIIGALKGRNEILATLQEMGVSAIEIKIFHESELPNE